MIRMIMALLLTAHAFAAGTAPAFEKYSALTGSGQMTTKLQQDSKFARKFKSLLSQVLNQGPDFAGKFRIVRIGCGSGCVGIGVLDCEKGQAFDSKMNVEQYGEDIIKLGDNIEYRKDSRLLILRGCINEDMARCGVSQFEWVGNKFVKLSFEKVGH